MKLDFTNIREFRDAFSSGKISKDAISTEGSLSIRGKKYAVKVIGGDTCTENQKCYCPPPIFIAAHAGKNRWPSSVKEFFTHRLANFSTKSQLHQLQTILRNEDHVEKKSLFKRNISVRKTVPTGPAKKSLFHRTKSLPLKPSALCLLNEKEIKLLREVAQKYSCVTAGSILSFLTNDGKLFRDPTIFNDEQIVSDSETPASEFIKKMLDNASTELFSKDNIDIAVNQKEGEAFIYLKNDFGSRIRCIPIDMRSGSVGEFRGAEAIQLLKNIDFSSLDDLADKISKDNSLNYAKRMALPGILNMLGGIHDDASARRVLTSVPDLEKFVRFDIRGRQFVSVLSVVDRTADNILHKLRGLNFYEMPLIANLDDIAAKFICQSDKNLIQQFMNERKLGKIKFDTYNDYLAAKDTRRIGADDIMPIREFLLVHHQEVIQSLRKLSMDDPVIFSLINKNLYEAANNEKNDEIADALDYELSKLASIHGLLMMNS